MSLVNDLLIELDRNRSGAARSDSAPLDGLSPRKQPTPAPTSSASRVPVVLALIAAGCLGFGIAQFGSAPEVDAAEDTSAASLAAHSAPSPASTPEAALPRVSAPRPQAIAGDIELSGLAERIAGPKAGPITPFEGMLRIERPIALQDLRIEQTGTATRVEITTDRSAEYRIDPGISKGAFNIVLEDAVLREPLPTLDLYGTAIRSVQTQHEDDAVRVELTLDADSHVQSQRVDRTEGALLIFDFQPTKKRAAAAAPRANTRRRVAETAKISGRSSNPSTIAEKPASGMKISRSANDRKRVDREDARQRAELAVASARTAREAGDLAGAAHFYETARKASPGQHDAIVEGASVLQAMNQTEEALALIEQARAAQPRDPVYLMVHAQILAEDDLPGAIKLLDAAGVSVSAAPEVHALTAAYLQKNGQHDSAIARYESILRRYPKRPKSWMGLGISLEARGRTAEAVDVYRIAMQLGELPGRSRGWISARIEALSEES
jgi:tetratricopeptide (TPR) repeat protein